MPAPSAAAALREIETRVVSCERCPELREYCRTVAREKRRAYREHDYWGRPVPGFGDPSARVLIIGLAPGAHGSNRTGRPFTGDASGDFLYPALYRAGFASQPDAISRDDGLTLRDCFITAAVRCAPPKNKPTPREMRHCFPYLLEEFDALQRTRVVIGLGSIGYAAGIAMLRDRGFAIEPSRPPFGHGAEAVATAGQHSIVAIASYHPSRQNTNTGKLTVEMFDRIFTRTRELLEKSPDKARRSISSRERRRR